MYKSIPRNKFSGIDILSAERYHHSSVVLHGISILLTIRCLPLNTTTKSCPKNHNKTKINYSINTNESYKYLLQALIFCVFYFYKPSIEKN